MKDEIIAKLKSQYPTLTKGIDDQTITLSEEEYESVISSWAEAELQEIKDNELKAEIEKQAEAKRQAAEAKLAALGLEPGDLKALGL
jgi:uncharacterized ferredoxin-like protein